MKLAFHRNYLLVATTFINKTLQLRVGSDSGGYFNTVIFWAACSRYTSILKAFAVKETDNTPLVALGGVWWTEFYQWLGKRTGGMGQVWPDRAVFVRGAAASGHPGGALIT